MSVIDDYLDNLAAPQRRELERIRAIVMAMVPDAEDAIRYAMPTLRYEQQNLIHFAAFKHHLSIFPGNIRFTADSPLPAEVIEEVVRKRLTEIGGD